MKITHRGTPAAKVEWIGKCNSCKSEATAPKSELKVTPGDYRGGPFAHHKCPVCELQDTMIFYPLK